MNGIVRDCGYQGTGGLKRSYSLEIAISDFRRFLRCYSTRHQFHKMHNIQEKVIVSLTTTPVRIKKMWPTLHSICLQSVQPEKIYLWIPKKFKRFPQNEILELPDFIKNNPYIQVEFIDHDYGPATKLLPCLQSPELRDKKIVVIDDDRIYPRHLIRDLLHYEQWDPSAAIGVAGTIVFGLHRKEFPATKKITKVDVLLGFNGYLVKPLFFSSTVFEYPENLPEAFFEDDVWFSCHLKQRGVRRMLIPSTASTQNLMTLNKKTLGLCMHENKDKQNFLRVFNYFNQQNLLNVTDTVF